MKNRNLKISFIGAGTIGTALGNIIAGNLGQPVLLHSIEKDTVDDININRLNSKYFPSVHLDRNLEAASDNGSLSESDVIFLAIPSVAMIDYLTSIREFLPRKALFVNLAKGFGYESKTIAECLNETFENPVLSMKGPSFAREIINRMPTGFTLGHIPGQDVSVIRQLFRNSSIHLDYSDDLKGVELLSILKNIYAVVLGIVDAQFDSPNLRFLVLTKAFREMRSVLEWFGGKEETLFKFCGYGDFTLTALNDLSRNRTFGLLVGKGFFSDHVSETLVLEGKTAVNIFFREMSKRIDVGEKFPIINELYMIFHTSYDISSFVSRILSFGENRQ